MEVYLNQYFTFDTIPPPNADIKLVPGCCNFLAAHKPIVLESFPFLPVSVGKHMLVPHLNMFLLQANEAWLKSTDVAKMYPVVTRMSHTNLNSESLYVPELKMATKKLPRMLPALRNDNFDRVPEKRPITSIYDMLYGKRVKINLSSANGATTPKKETSEYHAGTSGGTATNLPALKKEAEDVNDISHNAFDDFAPQQP